MHDSGDPCSQVPEIQVLEDAFRIVLHSRDLQSVTALGEEYLVSGSSHAKAYANACI